MDTEYNPEVYEEPMIVMQVRPEFSIQYKASPKIKFRKEHLKTKKDFIEHLSRISKNWKEGEYYLRSNQGPFASFVVKRGRKVNLIKEAKNRIPYLCWAYIGKKGKVAIRR